jgi:GNAT superfamily N-acetyltransferase
MIINIQDTSEFSDFIADNIEQYDFRYKYLIKVLNLIYSKEIPVNVTSFINEEEDGGWIMFIEIEERIYIYGLDYSASQISHFIETIDLKEYKGFEIMGTLDLVYKILKASEIQNYKLIKDRYFYQLINYVSVPSEDNIKLAKSDDLDELVLLFQNYYEEEYNGERNKGADFLIPTIKSFIQDQSLFVIKKDQTITTFCSIINPDIGIIFTKEEFRGQGLGQRLLEYCSSLLFEENEVAYLMTDKHNSASNKICQNIGYNIIYEHTNLKI